MADLLAYLDAHPEAWTVLGGLLAAAFGGRYALVRRAVLAAVQAAADQHPDDHRAQLEHVGKHRRRVVAKRAAAVIRKRMGVPPPLPAHDPLEADLDSDRVPTPLLSARVEDESRPTVPSRPPPPKRKPGEGGHQ